MNTADTGSAPVAISALSILSAVPLGVPVATIALGMAFAIVGVIGRAAFDIQKSLEGGSPVKLGQIIGWIGGGLLGAPFVAVLWIVMLRTIGAQTDTATVVGLLFLGFTGPKGVTWMMGFVTDFVRARFPAQKPDPSK